MSQSQDTRETKKVFRAIAKIAVGLAKWKFIWATRLQIFFVLGRTFFPPSTRTRQINIFASQCDQTAEARSVGSSGFGELIELCALTLFSGENNERARYLHLQSFPPILSLRSSICFENTRITDDCGNNRRAVAWWFIGDEESFQLFPFSSPHSMNFHRYSIRGFQLFPIVMGRETWIENFYQLARLPPLVLSTVEAIQCSLLSQLDSKTMIGGGQF